jgi:molybdopterin-containing oxidoreductase family iron-sulfur binding subunit
MSAAENSSRRAFLAAVAAAATGASSASAAEQEAPEAVAEGPLPKWGMAIDLDLCTGCGGCVVACKSENNVPLTGRTEEAEGTGIEWMSLLPQQKPEGSDVGLPLELLPTPCFHCENPPCVKVCPVNATYQNEEGIVAQVWDRCIGCRYCTVACPYSRRSFNWKHAEWEEDHRSYLNPDVALRPEGVVEKCTFCHHRVRRLREDAKVAGREIAPEEYERLPACAQACPAEAIIFGDLNDPESRVSQLAGSPRASRQQEHLGTKPKVYYLAKDRRER